MKNILEQKKQLREDMLDKRAKLNSKNKRVYDLWICEKLEEDILKRGSKVVHAYLPMGKEINILPLLKILIEKNITVVVPKTLPKRKLENRILTSLTAIERGVYGTTHPSNPNEYTGGFDFIIVPGLAYDKNKYRVGYGGGYYDNFLANHPNAFKMGIFYPIQEVENVPREPHDYCLDDILVNSTIEL